ncbi:hypothetical protein LTR86_011202 [Recurvomyces mirabilis]|nr:hypothetical protein LTR86_011202 [Recurvomyces mirabilis]
MTMKSNDWLQLRISEIEKRLGFKWDSTMSQAKERHDIPIIGDLDNKLKIIARQFSALTPTQLASNDKLAAAANSIFEALGPDLWPKEGETRFVRSDWLATATVDNLDGPYPKDLYYQQSDHKEFLQEGFYAWVVARCKMYRKNHGCKGTKRARPSYSSVAAKKQKPNANAGEECIPPCRIGAKLPPAALRESTRTNLTTAYDSPFGAAIPCLHNGRSGEDPDDITVAKPTEPSNRGTETSTEIRGTSHTAEILKTQQDSHGKEHRVRLSECDPSSSQGRPHGPWHTQASHGHDQGQTDDDLMRARASSSGTAHLSRSSSVQNKFPEGLYPRMATPSTSEASKTTISSRDTLNLLNSPFLVASASSQTVPIAQRTAAAPELSAEVDGTSITIGKITVPCRNAAPTHSRQTLLGDVIPIDSLDEADIGAFAQPRNGVILPLSVTPTQSPPRLPTPRFGNDKSSVRCLRLGTAHKDTNSGTILSRVDLEIDWGLPGELPSFADLSTCKTGEDIFAAIEDQRPDCLSQLRAQRICVAHSNPQSGELGLGRQIIRTSSEAAFVNLVRRLKVLSKDVRPELMATVKSWQAATETR